nr:hypothetical protein [Streptomyces sp. JHA19]
MLRAMWTTSTPGRRCALLGASAAVVVCVGAGLASCGGGGEGGEGFVATGPGGGPSGTPGPTGAVRLVPLPSGTPGDAVGRRAVQGPGSSTATEAGAPEAGTEAAGTAGGRPSGSSSPGPVVSGAPGTPAPSASAPTSPASPAPAQPARLVTGEPVREPADRRWCEKVTLAFHNTGGRPVRSGTVTFGSHVIGALGVDWSTVESTHDLPAPLAAGARAERTWTVCVDAWRVPLGMHVETRDVSVRWE